MSQQRKAWLTVNGLAEVAGISGRKARQAIARGAQGALWRGAALEVRTVVGGKGGAAGVRYEVAVSSLPPDLRRRLEGQFKPSQTPFEVAAPAPGRDAEIRWWSHHLTPLLMLPTGERAAAVVELATRDLLDWNLIPIRLSRSVIYQRLAQLEANGYTARGIRKDKGTVRTIVSRRWDKAVPFDEATKLHVAANVKQLIREKRADRTSRKWVLVHAQQWLMKETAARGFTLPDEDAFKALCAIPMELYTAEAKYEVVYDRTKDRDRFDNNLPRVRRTIDGMEPMDLVVADVHPADLLIRRSDGSVGAARMLAFVDVATRRVRAEIVMIEGKGGVRNTDGIKAFVSMAENPAWGLPRHFYVDNGSEYLFAGYLADAIALTQRQADGRPVIKANAYNAAAKQIEAWFRRFEEDHGRQILGWHGGKLGAPKRPARGKLPAPYQHGFEALCEEVQGHLAAYNAVHQPHGELGGDSPNSRFQKHVREGWAAQVIDPSQLLTVFTRTETRVVRQHGISVAGRTWSCPELDEYFGKTVTVKIPQLGLGFNELWIGDSYGNTLGIATPDAVASPLDTRQAQHSADRKRRTESAARELQRQVAGRAPAGADIIAFGEARPPVEPNPPHGRVSVGAGDDGRAFYPKAAPDREAEIQASHENTRERLAFFKKGIE